MNRLHSLARVMMGYGVIRSTVARVNTCISFTHCVSVRSHLSICAFMLNIGFLTKKTQKW